MAQKPKSKRDAYLQRVYGISEKQYQSLLEKQNGGCAICGKTPEEEGKSLAVDHIHLKGGGGEVRGVLCSYCNHRIVGRHKDPDLLLRVSKYISQGTGWFTPKTRKKTKKVKHGKKRVRKNLV